MTTGREEVGSEASIRVRRAAAAALAGGAFAIGVGAALAGASAARGDSGTITTAPLPPPPDPTSQTITSTPPPSTGSTQPKPPKDSTPPPRVGDLHVDSSTPGQITLTWKLVNASDVDHVFVNRGPAGRCPEAPTRIGNLYAGTTVGTFNPRTSQVDKNERDTRHYCYAVFTLDTAGNWAKPVIHLARNPGDTTPPAVVGDVTVAPAG